MSKAPKSEEAKNQDLKNPDAKSPDIRPQETKKPTNLQANAMPLDGYILSVDGKLKTRYESAQDAVAAGQKLKQSYPVIQVAVYDARERKYKAIEDVL